MRKGKPAHRSYLLHDEDFSIVAQYQSEFRGVVNYYLLAYNVSHFGKLKGVMEMSLARTLAAKHKSTARKMQRQYKSVAETEHGPRVCLKVVKQQDNGKRPKVAYFGGIPLKRQRQAVLVDQQPQRYRAGRNELTKRLLADTCEMCDSTVKVEIHHIRALRDLNGKGQRERPTGKAQVGTTHGGAETKDPCGLPHVSHGHPPRANQSAEADLTTGEPDAVKAARPVRRGADGKVLRVTGVTRRRPTLLGASAAYAAGFQRTLVLTPPHLTRKWKREVEQTVPKARAAIVASITDLEKLRLSTGPGPLFAIMSRERAKLSYRWQAAYIERWATSRGGLIRDEETGEPFRVPCCPICASQIVDKDGVPLTAEEMGRKRRTCAGCGSALWQADPKGPKRYPLADYIKKRMKGFFELLIGDEIHEYKGRGSAQGIAAGVLADSCGRSLTLTGTLTGGYSSTLFHLLYRCAPKSA